MARKKQPGKDLPPDVLTLSRHPRARRHIRRLRSIVGLAALALAVGLSLRAGAPPFDSLLRGLVAGVCASLLTWGCAVVSWRHLILAEIEAARRRALAARRGAMEGAES
jgi:hypothetical protein